jgi:hypothetical protein
MLGLIEAYMGMYEDELRARYETLDHSKDYALYGVEKRSFEAWAEGDGVLWGWEGAPFTGILDASPKERLSVYLRWNGIFGYTETIFAIATGEI